MKTISIIVPIYNAEEHLDKCVESILEQTEINLEIILVDDGSKDNSFEICKKYEKMDQRVKVIHQENAGVSAARNHGIEIAEGEYIGFVDSDDWIEPVMYQRLLKEAKEKNADVVMCDATTVYFDGPFYPQEGKTAKEKAASLRDQIYNTMQERSQNSTYEYVKYEKKPL